MNIGPYPVAEQIRSLADDADYRIQLLGTLGPPNFDLSTGTRKLPMSAWCLTGPLELQVDVLRYNEASGQLEGEYPCLTGF